MTAQKTGWQPLTTAPMWVHDGNALIGEWRGGRWHKVTLWEPTWTRDEIIARGGTHWWPHLDLLPPPEESP